MRAGRVAGRAARGAVLSLVCVTALAGAPAGHARAATPASTFITNPATYGNGPMSCPDPDVFQWGHRWIASCTSDYGAGMPRLQGGTGDLPAAFPIYTSRDLRTWKLASYILPPGHGATDAIPPRGHWPGGRYWADEIHHFDGRYEAYFGAQIDPVTLAAINQRYGTRWTRGTFGLYVAWTRNLLTGPWHTRLLHFPGQFNAVPGNGWEVSGGVIDPTVALDPWTGQLLIAWAKQDNQLFIGELSADALHMNPYVRQVFSGSLPWECATYLIGARCVEEGPVLYPDPVNHVMELFFNAGSTWDPRPAAGYKVGMAFSADPLHTWVKYPSPILIGSPRFINPGIGVRPFAGPGGVPLVAFHVQLKASHASASRYLAFGRLSWSSQTFSITTPSGAQRTVRVPQINQGMPTSSLPVG